MKLNFNSLRLKKYEKITRSILSMENDFKKLTDNQLKDKTKEFKKKIKSGITLEEILPEAYAAIREADYRVLGMKPFDNQVLGAVVLHFGNVAEMNTGEGKTLTATMPMYLNGLTGPGNFLITANGYLANRDADEIGKVYHWMGLTSTSGISEGVEIDKKLVYQNDIVYTTNSELGFDFLIDNLADSITDKKLNQLNFALVDEVDSVLLDLAQTPLVISGAPRVQSNLFVSTDRIIKNLKENVDYELSEDTKSVWFTKKGIKNLEKYLGIQGLVNDKWEDLYRHLVLALRANHLMKKNRDYVVEENEILLLDVENGRALTGMKLEAGTHQAIEAKEEVSITPQTRSMASITLQNFFKMFGKLSGMTGTARTSAREFLEVYNLPVLRIPTHKPNIRKDYPDIVYGTIGEKIDATVELVKKAYKKGRPVLVETGSVSLSRLYSRVLLREGIIHNVLNAQSESKEAMIVADAGQKGAITVATSMAGRGTDIKLGEGVKELGGLLVIGTERMASQRVDNQLRGRAGRQGDPGESVFLVSLEDKIVIENGPEWVENYRKRLKKELENGKREYGKPIKKNRIRKVVERAQRSASDSSEDGRKSAVKMDDVLRIQRGLIYKFRDMVMQTNDVSSIIEKIKENYFTIYSEKLNLTEAKITDFIINNIDYNYTGRDIKQNILNDPKAIKKYIEWIAGKSWANQLIYLNTDFKRNYLERLAILKAIDVAWIEQVDNLQQLKSVVGSRSSAQHNPIYEYEKEAMHSFNQMKELFWENTIRYIYLSKLITQNDGSTKVEFP
ncbi:accessory Sec system translocase SecA2 [Pediococcus stilesii]|uniref:Protein translocase subunit SecA n=1 Tax=Pediococcus stilesii TaxID=331679 RepID=A0A5R9BVV5_9LACO|nr:accessory Sec system translocase SecA2 [Pediococcus stilesii]TLQ04828.1 accessory Sec system translocase SecA2 [Pediococcus stilesii]